MELGHKQCLAHSSKNQHSTCELGCHDLSDSLLRHGTCRGRQKLPLILSLRSNGMRLIRSQMYTGHKRLPKPLKKHRYIAIVTRGQDCPGLIAACTGTGKSGRCFVTGASCTLRLASKVPEGMQSQVSAIYFLPSIFQMLALLDLRTSASRSVMYFLRLCLDLRAASRFCASRRCTRSWPPSPVSSR